MSGAQPKLHSVVEPDRHRRDDSSEHRKVDMPPSDEWRYAGRTSMRRSVVTCTGTARRDLASLVGTSTSPPIAHETHDGPFGAVESHARDATPVFAHRARGPFRNGSSSGTTGVSFLSGGLLSPGRLGRDAGGVVLTTRRDTT